MKIHVLSKNYVYTVKTQFHQNFSYSYIFRKSENNDSKILQFTQNMQFIISIGVDNNIFFFTNFWLFISTIHLVVIKC